MYVRSPEAPITVGALSALLPASLTRLKMKFVPVTADFRGPGWPILLLLAGFENARGPLRAHGRGIMSGMIG